MKSLLTLTGAIALSSGAAFADSHASGDPAAGESAFTKCGACHVIERPDGERVAGRGQAGPNLYGLAGRQAGGLEGYNYGDSLVEAGEAGLEWNEAEFVSYVADPRGYLKEYNDDSGARSKMSFRLNNEQEAKDIWAYLAQYGEESM